MSEVEDKTDDLTEIKNKINRCNKNIREQMEMVKATKEKMNQKPVDDEKEKVEKNL